MELKDIMDGIQTYERERNGVTALFPERYQDLAEYLLILLKKKPKKVVAKKIPFERSDIFNKHAFKARFSDWSSDKLRHYHNAALTYSLEGNKYVNWDRAIQNWASSDDARGKFKWLPDSPVTSQPLNGLVI